MTKLAIRTPHRGKCNLMESKKISRMGAYAEAAEAGHLEGADVILMDYNGTDFHRQSEMQRK